MEFLIVIGGIALLFYIFKSFGNLEHKIEQLESKVKRLEVVVGGETQSLVSHEVSSETLVVAARVASEHPQPVFTNEMVNQSPVPISAIFRSTKIPTAPTTATMPVRMATEPAPVTWWGSQDVLTKVGAVLVLISIGSFLGYAVVSGWIGPVAQVLLAFLAGGACLLYGVSVIHDERPKGSVFVGLGSGIILLSTLVSMYVYHLMDPLMGGIVMWLPIVVTAYLSILYRYEAMAIFSLLLAIFVPALVDSTLSGLSVCVYLGIVSLGAVAVAMTIGSRLLVPIALTITALSTLSFAESPEKFVIFTAVNCLMLLFSLANMVTLTHEREGKYSSYVTTAGISGVWLLLWIAAVLPDKAGVPLYLVWSVLFIFGAYVIGRVVQHKMVPRVYVGVSILYLTFATLYLFDGMALVLVVLAEVTTLVLTYLYGLRAVVFARRLLWAYSFPLFLSTPFLSAPEWNNESFSFHEPFLVVAAVSLVMLGMGWLFARQREVVESGESVQAHHVLYGIGGFYLNLLLAQSLSQPALTVVWLCEVGALALYHLRVGAITSARYFLVGYAVPVIMALSYVAAPEWKLGVVHTPFFVLLSTIIVLFSIAIQFSVYDQEGDGTVSQIFYSIGTFFTAAFIWLVLHAALSLGIATMFALIIYTAVGLVLYIGGIRTYDNFSKILGLVGIGGVVARLLFVEVWELSAPLRIVAFMIIGLMLLSTAFMKNGRRGVNTTPVPPATSNH